MSEKELVDEELIWGIVEKYFYERVAGRVMGFAYVNVLVRGRGKRSRLRCLLIQAQHILFYLLMR